MANRRKLHGRRRHPSRCTAPFKKIGNPEGEPKTDLPLFGHDSTSTDEAGDIPDLKLSTTQEPMSTRVAVPDPNLQNVTPEGGWMPGVIEEVKARRQAEKDAVPTIQKIQTALTPLEIALDGPLAPFGAAVGAVQTGLSLGRSGYHYLKGETEAGHSNLIDAGLSAVGIVPGLGIAATTAKIGKNTMIGLKTAGNFGYARHLDDTGDIAAEMMGIEGTSFGNTFGLGEGGMLDVRPQVGGGFATVGKSDLKKSIETVAQSVSEKPNQPEELTSSKPQIAENVKTKKGSNLQKVGLNSADTRRLKQLYKSVHNTGQTQEVYDKIKNEIISLRHKAGDKGFTNYSNYPNWLK
jgi:hypothetical protein